MLRKVVEGGTPDVAVGTVCSGLVLYRTPGM
jgi:hypothetical protein